MLPSGQYLPGSQGSRSDAEGQKLPRGHSFTPLQVLDTACAMGSLLPNMGLASVREVWPLIVAGLKSQAERVRDVSSWVPIGQNSPASCDDQNHA